MTDEALLFEQRELPTFQNRLHDTADAARSCPRGDVRLIQNLTTGLIYNSAFQPSEMIYDEGYDAVQDCSPTYMSHLNDVANIVESALGCEEILEIGCGKAYFLELLQSRGTSITGIDPSYSGDNPAVERLRFEETRAIRPARGIILRHVLEHLYDPLAFLRNLQAANGGHGRIYIEAPCFDWILSERSWFSIFYEHVNYFRMADLRCFFSSVMESGYMFGGQYMYVVADLSTLKEPSHFVSGAVTFPTDFLSEVSVLTSTRTKGPRAVWGAGSRGVIYALLRERQGDPVTVLIDINPAKWGRYIPASGLRVCSPEAGIALLEEGSEICVMNRNYMPEVHTMTEGRYKLVGVGRG